jgi:hypothetical protein
MKKLAIALFAGATFCLPAFAFAAAPQYNVSGPWVFTFNYGGPYAHEVTLAQDGSGNVTGSGGYPAGGPHVYEWAVTSGSVSGNAINLTANYTLGNDALSPLTTMHINGTIAADGTISGTWDDNYQGSTRNGTWASTSGSAAPITPTCSSDDTTFDTFTNGSVNGQHGWMATGPYDQTIVDNTYGISSFGCKSLRLSNGFADGAFGGQTFAPLLASGAGETSIAPNKHFEAQFDVASVLSSLQAGLAVSVSPDNGSGARMSYLRFEDQAEGIHVHFVDVTDAGPLGTVAAFHDSDITTITRAPHTIKFVMDFVDGPANDIVKIYIDGSLVKTGTSWEDYYRYDPEQAGGGNLLSPVKTLIFAARGDSGVAANLGNGYLFDNVTLSSGPTPMVKVQIFKYVDGVLATAVSANNAAFPMLTTFNSTNLGNVVDVPFTLSPTPWGGIGIPYEADFIGSVAGADYTAHEVTTGNDVVGASCAAGKPFALAGYSVGDTIPLAAAAAKTATAPAFTDLQSDHVVIVWNTKCVALPPPSVVPTTKEQCMDNGWKTLKDAIGGKSFKNQGDCVSFVATKGKNTAAGKQ